MGFLALLALAMACGAAAPPDAPAPPPRTAPAAPVSVRVEPLAFAHQAHAPDRALILGTARGSIWLPLSAPATTVLLRPRHPALPPAGPLWLTAWVRPTPPQPAHADDGRYQRLLAEPTRPAAWAALQATAMTLGKNLTDLRYVAVPAEAAAPLADEPMAGAWLAAVFLASLTDAPVDPDAAVAGLLLPDGAVLSLAPGDARIRDVRDAYTRLTGQILPAPEPVRARDMAVPAPWQAHLSALYPAWRGVLAGSWAQILQLTGPTRLPPALDQLARTAEQQAREAEELRARGAALPAYERMVSAASHAVAAAALQDVLARVRAGDTPAARARLHAMAVAAAARLHEARRAADARVPTTLDEHALLMDAYQQILRSTGIHAAASQRLAAVEQALDALGSASPLSNGTSAVVEGAVPAALLLARAESEAQRALDLLSLAPAEAAPHACAAGDLRHLALAHAAASAASLRPLEHGPGAASAARPGLPPELPVPRAPEATTARAAIEHAVLWARTDSALGSAPCGRAVAALAAAMLARIEIGRLALQQQVGRHARAPHILDTVLARAERKAREHARAAQVATGGIPAPARLAYTRARLIASRAGDAPAADPAMLARAIEHYWQASMHAHAAVLLARNHAAPEMPHP